MKTRSIIILFIVLAAVAAYFFLVDEKRKQRNTAERLASRRILAHGPSDVDSVIFINPQKERIEWMRQGENWLITYPTTTMGSRSTIDAFLFQILPGRKLSPITGVKNLADFGLDDPFATLIFFYNSPEPPDTIFVGDKTPVGNNCYIRVGGSPEVIVSREITRNMMNKNLYHLRDKNFMRIDPELIKGIRIKSPLSDITIVRLGDSWVLAGSRLGVDRDLIMPFLKGLTDAMVYEFVQEDTLNASKYGIGDPENDIFIYTDTDTITISLGRTEGDFAFAVRSGIDKVLSVKAWMKQVFDWVEGDIIVLNLTLFDPEEVRELHYETPDTSLTLKLESDGWRSTKDPAAGIDSYQVGYFLMILRGLAFERLLDEGAEGKELHGEKPVLEVTLKNSTGDVIDIITFFRLPSGDVAGGSLTAGTSGLLKPNTFGQIAARFAVIGSKRN